MWLFILTQSFKLYTLCTMKVIRFACIKMNGLIAVWKFSRELKIVMEWIRLLRPVLTTEKNYWILYTHPTTVEPYVFGHGCIYVVNKVVSKKISCNLHSSFARLESRLSFLLPAFSSTQTNTYVTVVCLQCTMQCTQSHYIHLQINPRFMYIAIHCTYIEYIRVWFALGLAWLWVIK